jgi:DNA repair protein RecN (Recombination protein N)
VARSRRQRSPCVGTPCIGKPVAAAHLAPGDHPLEILAPEIFAPEIFAPEILAPAMLSHLTIRDFAIVEALELELRGGLSVLTGETGAGKSILLDALGLVLGERAGASLVRAGAERAEVVAVFDLAADGDAAGWLREHDLEASEGECIVRRTVSAEGRSRAFVNARPVPVQTLRQLGDLLVDIHGQHAHQSLLRTADQRDLLDRFADNEALLARIAAVHADWLANEAERERLGSTTRDREAREDYLRYQLEELREGLATPSELEALTEEHRRLAHADQLLASAAQGLEMLTGEDSAGAIEQAATALRELEGARRSDETLADVCELLESGIIQLREATAELRRYRDDVEIAPERLAELESRLDTVEALARKHRIRPEALEEQLAELERELEESVRSAERLAAVERQRDSLIEAYAVCDTVLADNRRAAAARLGSEIGDKLGVLGMQGAQLEVEVTEDDRREPRRGGGQSVRFLAATNPGQPLRVLAEVASGGELSRISLAIQVVGNQDRGIPTLIFDEVDAGVGGRLAEMVGRELRRLGEHRQVLCVTHLPQVASQAHHHVQVAKRSAGGRTWTSVKPLAGEERVMELARMLGGEQITEQTVAHAREMLTRD